MITLILGWLHSASPVYCSTNDDYTLFALLKNPQLCLAEQATVQGLKLTHRDIEFHFERGVIFHLASVEGKITGFYFSGKGWAAFTPSDSGEAGRLDRVAGGSGGREKRPFDRLYCRFADWQNLSFSRTPVFVPILQPKNQDGLVEQLERWFAKTLADCQDGARLSLFNPYVEIFRDLKANRRRGSFYAVYTYGEMGAAGGRFYRFEPRDFEEIAYNGWCRYSAPQKPGRTPAAPRPPVKPVWYDIAAEINSSGHIDFRIEGRYVVSAGPLAQVFLQLSPVFQIRSITNEHGEPLDYWAGRKKDDFKGLFVFLNQTHARGDTLVLNFDYGGQPAVQTPDGGFYLPHGLHWYPTIPSFHKATYDARFSFPRTMSLVASGRKIKEENRITGKHSYWVLGAGSSEFSFSFGPFKTRDYFYEGIPPVTIYSHESAAPEGAEDLLKDVAAGVLNRLGYFKRVYGPFPFENLTVVEVPEKRGQAFAGMVQLPQSAFQAENRNPSTALSSYEVARQWWGFVLREKTYHDRWFIEGVAEYSSVLYVEKSRKRKDISRRLVELWREDILEKASSITSVPLRLGGRSSGEFPRAKSAYVMHMLRVMMMDLDIGSDWRFTSMLRDFLEYYRGEQVTVEDFKHQAELYYGRSLDWFFRQWVDEEEIPTYAWQQEVKRLVDGQYIINLEVEQRGVGENFKMPVPVSVIFRNRRPHRQRVWVSGAETTVKLGPFERRPEKVIFNDFGGVLAWPAGSGSRIAKTESRR